MPKASEARKLLEEQRINDRKRNLRLLSLVEERMLKQQAIEPPYFHSDVMIKIFLLLPVRSLLILSCVCKTWKQLICSSNFVEAYNSRAKPVLIFVQSPKHVKPSPFCIETQARQAENFSFFPETAESGRKSFVHFLEIQDGNKGHVTNLNISCSGCSDILAASDGLLLVRTLGEPPLRRTQGSLETYRNQGKPQRYIVINPVTRKLTAFPLGTIASPLSHPSGARYESHGIVFSQCYRTYKLVHLFFDKERNAGCEILCLRTKRWKAINGPKSGLFRGFPYAPVSALGALHWLPAPIGMQYMVSLDAGNEKFYEKELPSIPSYCDRLIQMDGGLGFVSINGEHIMDVWILKALHQTEWTRQHTVDIDPSFLIHERLVPMFTMDKDKVIVLQGNGKYYTYDFKIGQINEVEMEDGCPPQVLPHVNNLATWEPLESLR